MLNDNLVDVLAHQFVESFDEFLLVGIVVLIVDRYHQLVESFTNVDVTRRQGAIVVQVEPSVEQYAALAFLISYGSGKRESILTCNSFHLLMVGSVLDALSQFALALEQVENEVRSFRCILFFHNRTFYGFCVQRYDNFPTIFSFSHRKNYALCIMHYAL